MKELDLRAKLEQAVSSGRMSRRAAITLLRHNRRGGNYFNDEAGFKEFPDGTENLSDSTLSLIARMIKPKKQRDGD